MALDSRRQDRLLSQKELMIAGWEGTLLVWKVRIADRILVTIWEPTYILDQDQ